MPRVYDKDPYAILGISSSATSAQIKEAYRRLARQYHPDLNKDPRAADRMKDINWANEILGDPNERRMYDMYRSAGVYGSYTGRTYSPPPNQAYTRPPGTAYHSPNHNYSTPRGAAYNPPRRETRRVPNYSSSGCSLVFILWAVMSLISNLARTSSRSSPQILPTFPAQRFFLQTIISPGTQTAIAESAPDIRDQIKPGTVEWSWIDTMLADYHLTTSQGLSDEVLSVRHNVDSNELLIETRQYGVLRVSMWLASYSTVTPIPALQTVLVVAPTLTTNPDPYNLRASITPGSIVYKWINQYLGGYHLTTPDGLSDEVTRVTFDQNRNGYRIETRTLGTFWILINRYDRSVIGVRE